MPSGQTHELHTIGLAASVATLTLLSGDFATGIPSTIGCLLGIYLTPDLDIPTNSLPKDRIKSIPFIGPVYAMYWQPYSEVFRHRSFLSHGMVISTVIRIAYSMLWIPFFTMGATYEFLWLLTGLCLVDSAHSFMDFSSTRLKRFRLM